MKQMIHDGRVFCVKDIDCGWVELYMDGVFIGKMISFEEARKVIWLDLVGRGEKIEYVYAEDFDEVDNCV